MIMLLYMPMLSLILPLWIVSTRTAPRGGGRAAGAQTPWRWLLFQVRVAPG